VYVLRTTHWQLPQIEDIEKEQSIEDNDLENDLENNNNTSQHDEITGVSEADNTPSNVTAGSNDMPVITSPLTNDSSTDVHEQQDYCYGIGLGLELELELHSSCHV
jgi:hypothetical protein